MNNSLLLDFDRNVAHRIVWLRRLLYITESLVSLSSYLFVFALKLIHNVFCLFQHFINFLHLFFAYLKKLSFVSFVDKTLVLGIVLNLILEWHASALDQI